MDAWVIYAVFGMLQVGLLMALYKVPAAKKINKYGLSMWSYVFGIAISGILLYSSIVFDIKTLVYAFIWGTGFTILSLAQMHILHKHDTSGVFPFTSLASNVLVILGGVLFLNEVLSLLQWIAVSASVVLFIVPNWNNRLHFVSSVLP